MRTILCLAVFLTASANGWELFVPDRQYRFCKNGDANCPAASVIAQLPEPKDHQASPGRKHQDEILIQDGYRMAFIEYQDSGNRWDNVQLASAKVLIERARREGAYGGPIHLVMFVHGWANNADESPADPRDVERFQSYLKYYANTFNLEKWPVVGIYFAWHGRSLNLNHGAIFPSFWTRSAAARRVGRGMLDGDFQCIAKLATYDLADGKKPEKHCEAVTTFGEPTWGGTTGERQRSRVIVMAHSFGARVLETALVGGEPSKGDFAGACKTLIHGEAARPPVDLVIFENAATSSRLIRRQFMSCQPCGRGKSGCSDFANPPPRDFSKSVMLRAWAFDKSYCESPEHRKERACQPYPLIVSVSGKFDLLTRFLQPIASGGIPAAFLPWLESHKLTKLKNPESPPDPDKEEVLVFDACTSLDQNNDCVSTESYLMQRKRTGSVAPVNPMWTMAVPQVVIRKHGDVWNHGYLHLHQSLLALRSGTTYTAGAAGTGRTDPGVIRLQTKQQKSATKP